jgi:site-specific DNA-methyltransferase (adenine-specific)
MVKTKMSKIIHGDCLEELKKLPDNSVDAIVSDPPYGLGFMGKKWDIFTPKEYQQFSYEWGKEVLRVLKPGGNLVAFSGTRTYHRMVTGLEDAGFIIRDQLDWLYGSGFPKSLNISKAIDKYKGLKREIVGKKQYNRGKGGLFGNVEEDDPSSGFTSTKYGSKEFDITKPACKESKLWKGWKTGLKPAHEPIVLAMKPLDGNYAENVLKWSVGGINIDASRIHYQNEQDKNNACSLRPNHKNHNENRNVFDTMDKTSHAERGNPNGRYPSNVLIDDSISYMIDEQFHDYKGGTRKHNRDVKRQGLTETSNVFKLGECGFEPEHNNSSFCTIGDAGGVSKYYKRFFYNPKADSIERNLGLNLLYDTTIDDGREKTADVPYQRGKTKRKNSIATLKPINVMRWLVKLVCPPGGIVLDPFAGSGTTGCACVIEGFKYILIEKRKEFATEVIPLRIRAWSDPENWKYLKPHKELETKTYKPKTKSLRNL